MDKLALRLMLTLTLVVLTSTACGPHKVKGKSPFVSISSMSLKENALGTRFDVRNINDVDMVIDSIELNIRSRDRELTRLNRQISLTIGPNTTEEVTVDLPLDETTSQQIAALERGDEKSISFQMEGRVHTRDDGFMEFNHDGYLFPVPGRPGQFRSTTTNARQQR